jgi:hypothetical protein
LWLGNLARHSGDRVRASDLPQYASFVIDARSEHHREFDTGGLREPTTLAQRR